MIVVMGASGRVGGTALELIADAGRPVRGVARTLPVEPRGNVEWAKADASDPSALAATFEGAEAVFVLNPVSPHATDVHAEADRISSSIAEALTMASVPYAVALSSQGAHLGSGTGVVTTLHRFEEALRRTRTELTILRAAYFIESWVPMALQALATGELPAFLDPVSRRIDAVSTRDVGMFAARHLLEPMPGVVNLVGPARCGDADAAATLSRLYGRAVRLLPIPAHRIAAVHEAAGLSPSLAAETAAMYEAINGTGIPFEEKAGRFLAGRVSLEQVLSNLPAR